MGCFCGEMGLDLNSNSPKNQPMTSGALFNIRTLRLRFSSCKIEPAVFPPKLSTQNKITSHTNKTLKDAQQMLSTLCLLSKFWQPSMFEMKHNVLKWQSYLHALCKYLIHKVVKEKNRNHFIGLNFNDLSQIKY